MSRWFKCHGCPRGCVWIDSVLYEHGLIFDLNQKEPRPMLCPAMMVMTDFKPWGNDDVSDAMNLMESNVGGVE